MASLQELLAQEGFERGKFFTNSKPVKFRDRKTTHDESVTLPIYICHDRKSSDFLRQRSERATTLIGSSVFSSKRVSSDYNRSNSKSLKTNGLTRSEPAIDEVAIRAVISILSGYIGRYVKDEKFREMMTEKCNSCLKRRTKDSDNGIFANMELGIESIEKLVEEKRTKKEVKLKSLRNSIQLLSIVSSLNSKKSRNGTTCGVPNSNLSACAQLYLSIVYKLDKNDRISARHLLQVFRDSPFLARTHLLPDLWGHFFLPHLLHLKVWYHKEVEFLSNSGFGEKEKRLKALSKVYNDHMDMGTTLFALYYKEWLHVGAKAPAPTVPTVPLPARPSYGSPRTRRRSSDSYISHSSINKNLYRAVFGSIIERKSMDLDHRNGASIDTWDMEEEEKVCTNEDNYNNCNYVPTKVRSYHRSSSQAYGNVKTESWPETQKLDYFRFLTCQSVPTECMVTSNHIARNCSIRKEENTHLPSSDFSRAITTICSSDSLSDCEISVRVVTKAWLDSHGDPIIEAAISKAPVIEGMLEVLFASNNDEILELAISILAELVAKNETNRQIVLNSDPQLEIFMRLLRSSSLFLKAAVLLYQLKPKAKQMISIEWVPLVLRVLEFWDQFQTLFTVRCSPQVAAFYILEQIITGFNEDKNLENAGQVVSLGGLSLLVRSMEKGDIPEKNKAALIISCCIQADGSCRNYLADNLNKASLLELIVRGNHKTSRGSGFTLLTELLCLNRRTKTRKFLDGLKNGWGGLNSMHIMLACLQKASPEECPLVAAILLQLDLLGDPLKHSVYREEAVEAIIAALDCQKCNEKVQEQSAKALLMLRGRFSHRGEATAEIWLSQEAGFCESSGDSFHNNEIVVDENLSEEEEALENWQRKAALVLLNSGNKRLLAALSNSIANGTPNLARASLFTIAWMSRFLHSTGDENFQSMACSLLVPQLLESSNYDKALEERALASFSLRHLIRNSECVSLLSSLNQELVDPLQNP